MPIFRNGDVSVLFVHVPKAGGSSIEDLFRDSGWEIELLDRNEPGSFNRHRRCSPQHMHAAILSERLRMDSFDLIFTIVREPLARFRSEIVMRNPQLDAPWSPEAAQFTRSTLRKYPADPYIGDNHIRPQTEYYLPGAKVFRFEDGLEQAAAMLRDVYELELDLSAGMPHNTARHGAMSGSAVEIPEHLRAELVDFYREDYLRFGYEYPAR